MSNTSNILDEIYSKINRSEILNTLNPKQKGDYLELDCPICLKPGVAFIYDNGFEIICNREKNCGQKTTIWNYIQKENNLSQQATLKFLADNANIILPAITDKGFQQICDQRKTEDLLTLVLAFYKKQLLEVPGRAALQYLIEKRGYSLDEIEKMDLGFNPGKTATDNFLATKAFLPSQIEIALRFLDARDSHPLVFPYRDKHRQITSLWGRTIDPEVKDKKYLPYTETTKAQPFNIDKASGEEFILVEGFFDAMITTASGCKNVIALGGSHLTKDQLEVIINRRCKRIILALDNDKAGIDGTEESIKLLNQTNIEVFVASLPVGVKDPDELIVKQGIEAFSKLINTASSISSWLPQRIKTKHVLKTDIGHKDALNEAVAMGKQIKDPFECNKFLRQTADIFDVPLETLTTEIDSAKKDDQKKLQLKNTEKYLSIASNLLKEGDLEALSLHLTKNKPDLMKESESKFKIQFLQEEPTNFLTSDAPEMPRLLSVPDGPNTRMFIPKGIVGMVAGAGGVGKTHFLTQLALAVASGDMFLGKYLVQNQGHVFFVLGENTRADIHRLLRKTYKKMYPTPEQQANKADICQRLAVASVMGMNAALINKENNPTIFYMELLAELKNTEPIAGWDLIIFDPISRLLGPLAETDNDAATQFIALLEKMILELKGNPTILFAHHMNKSGLGNTETDQTAARGSSAITDGARWQANLDKTLNPNYDKSNNTAPLNKYDPNKITFRVVKSNHTAATSPEILIRDNYGNLIVESCANDGTQKTLKAKDLRK
jgi:DNA primase catalytic core